MKILSGFSLIELTLVFALITLILSLCVPALTINREHIIRAHAHQIRLCAWYEQQMALAQGHTRTLEFDTHTHTYWTQQERNSLSDGVHFGIIPDAYGPPAHPIKLLVAPITLPNQRATFYPSGTISAGSIYLIDKTGSLLYAVTIPVSSFSYIRIYRWVKNTWSLCQ